MARLEKRRVWFPAAWNWSFLRTGISDGRDVSTRWLPGSLAPAERGMVRSRAGGLVPRARAALLEAGLGCAG